jgi:hypothetical protein
LRAVDVITLNTERFDDRKAIKVDRHASVEK